MHWLEDLLKEEFGCKSVKSCGGMGGGCISSGGAFMLDDKKVFVKQNPSHGSRLMFDGEFASLKKIFETKVLKVPEPIKVFSRGDKSFLIMEYHDISPLSTQAANLGERVAKLHLQNKKLKSSAVKAEGFVGKSFEYVDKFGFEITTCCGFLPLNNEWSNNWVDFYVRNRLKMRIDRILRNYQDRDVFNLWPEVERKITSFFPKTLEIIPALLHGDLWGGNAGELDSEPCTFDPACSYGHSEFDLAISFGSFPSAFFDAYHKIIPKEPGFENRMKLYRLFHSLNHWNHFGSGYKSSSISLFQEIASIQSEL